MPIRRRTDLPYRFSSWAFDDPDNVCLLFDADDHLVAWAALQTPFWTIDFALRADAPPQIYQMLVQWADQRIVHVRGTRSARPIWFINVFSHQQQRIADLEAAGWANQANVGEHAWSKVFMLRSSDTPVERAPVPSGWTIRPLAGASEVAAYVALHRAVFESESMTEPWRHRTLQQPAYDASLDLVAVAPDGQFAAFCVCWFDAVGPTGRPCGQIEPLGVGVPFRQHGLGRAILTEGLYRLQQHGAQDIVVETDNYRNDALTLYEQVGFEVVHDVFVFRKDVVSG